MERPPRAGPPPVRESRVSRTATAALTRLVAGAIDTDVLAYCLYLLAKEELDRAYDTPYTATVADPEEQPALDWVRAFVQQDRTPAFARFVEQICRLYPAEARMFEDLLPGHLTTLLLIDLGRRPVEPHLLGVVRLSPDNPLRVRRWTDESMLIEFPHQVAITTTHVWELLGYRNAWRPARKRGPRAKPPATPTARRRHATDAEARRAWALAQAHPGATLDTLARTLRPEAPMSTEQERRRMRATVRRRIARGRLLASDPTPPARTKNAPP
jgi:hypothetical protein